jgi:hypothetical protein
MGNLLGLLRLPTSKSDAKPQRVFYFKALKARRPAHGHFFPCAASGNAKLPAAFSGLDFF